MENKSVHNRTRNLSLDGIKGLAILLVMVGHVIVLNNMADPFLYDGIKVLQMPLFIIISGYISGFGRKVTTVREYGMTIGKRAVSYVLPFFAWLIILHPGNFMWAIGAAMFQLDRGLWFLMTLFILNVMTYTAQLLQSLAMKAADLRSAKKSDQAGNKHEGSCLASNETSKGNLVFWGCLLLLSVLVFVQSGLGLEFLSPGLTKYYLPFYIAGYAAAFYRDVIFRYLKTYHLNILFLLSGTVFLFLDIRFDLLNVSTIAGLGIQVAASFTGCFAVIYLMCRLKDGKIKRFFCWLGLFTLEIYTVHYHFATLLNRSGKQYQLYSLNGIIFVIISFTIMCILTSIIIFVIKKIPPADLILFGKQNRKRFDK